MTVFLLKRNRLFLHAGLSVVIALLVLHTIMVMKHEKQKKLVVFDIKNQKVISLINGRTAVFISDFEHPELIPETFQIKNYFIKKDIRQVLNFKLNSADTLFENSLIFYKKNGDNIFFGSEGFRGSILGSPELIPESCPEKMHLDCIILSKIKNAELSKLTDVFNFDYLVVSEQKKLPHRDKGIDYAATTNFKIHSLLENHAFELNFD